MLPTKKAWLLSRDCFKILLFVVMQPVARVCQRQLSYLSLQTDETMLPLTAESELFLFQSC